MKQTPRNQILIVNPSVLITYLNGIADGKHIDDFCKNGM
jgi:hypothetical protein